MRGSTDNQDSLILQAAIARGLAYAPHADLLWVETSSPDFEEAKEFAEAIHAKYPGKMLAYNCSPSFNWKKHLSDKQIASFQVAPPLSPHQFPFAPAHPYYPYQVFISVAAWKMLHHALHYYVFV